MESEAGKLLGIKPNNADDTKEPKSIINNAWLTNDFDSEAKTEEPKVIKFMKREKSEDIDTKNNVRMEKSNKQKTNSKRANKSCPKCSKRFIFQKALQKHFCVTACQICGKPVKDKFQLEDHMNSKHLKGEFSCHVCQKIFVGRTTLSVHMRKHHANVDFRLQCDQCDKMFNYKYSLDAHKKKAHKIETKTEETKPFPLLKFNTNTDPDHQSKPTCTICNRKFAYGQGLKNHIALVHEGGNVLEKFKCRKCPKGFEHTKDLRQHEKEAHYQSNPTCTICGRQFTYAENLKKHMTFCSDYTIDNDKKNHLALVNENEGANALEKKFKCRKCPEKFKHIRNLRQHNLKKHLILISRIFLKMSK